MNDRERVSVGSQSQTEDNLLHETQADSSAFSRASQWQLIRWRFLKHRVAVIALGVLALLYLCALFAEFVAPYDPRSIDSKYTHAPPQRIRILYNGQLSLPYVFPVVKGRDPQTLATQYTENTNAPSRLRLFARGDSYRLWGMLESDIHLFGVKNGRFMPFGGDAAGRDIFSRTIFGARLSLTIGLLGVFLALLLGILLGGISGYFGRTPDVLIQRLIETLRSIPTLPLWLALSVALPDHWSIPQRFIAITVVLSIVGWADLAREVRGKFMALREEGFVRAAELGGASTRRLIFSHMLPSFYSHIIAATTLSVPVMILGETTSSFLSLGLQAPAISWGVLLSDAQHFRVISQTPWFMIPGLFVVVTVLAFNFLGDGLRDAADPYAN
ncbi:MAG: ABC transporter permease [Candidatus Poribacteria bacterium]|nr:ABC transporter permease [Candidatus Poribacteria bacterium]